MVNSREIIFASIESTRRRPRWWILALAQILALFVIGRLNRPIFSNVLFFSLVILAVVVLQPATAWLWTDMETVRKKQAKRVTLKIFSQRCFINGCITLCVMIVAFLARLIYHNWIFLTFVSSFAAATGILAMLYVIICNQNFFAAWALAADTWHKKVSLAMAAAVSLVVVHGIFFALAHEIGKSILVNREFSVFSHSATIWVLLALMVLAAAFLAAVLNCFLVFLFLEIIKRRKDPENAEAAIEKFAVPHAQA